MERKVTIKDIAQMAEVSKSSVSRYLNGGYVSKENAAKIKLVIEKTGFQSNFFAKRLKKSRSNLMGIVLPRIDSFTAGKILTGINACLEENQYQGFVLISDLKVKNELERIKSLFQQGVDGIIVNSIAITDEHLKLADTLPVPIIFTGQKHPSVHCVKADDYQAGYMMGEYLQAQGHKNIVFVGVAEHDQAVGVERRQGFMEAVASDCRVDFVETDFSFNAAFTKGEEVLAYRPTAVVGATDNISLGIMHFLHERGITIPDMVSVVGFGGYDVGMVAYPPLTTVQFAYDLLGRYVAEGIFDLLEGKEALPVRQVPMKLVERKSVACLKR